MIELVGHVTKPPARLAGGCLGFVVGAKIARRLCREKEYTVLIFEKEDFDSLVLEGLKCKSGI